MHIDRGPGLARHVGEGSADDDRPCVGHVVRADRPDPRHQRLLRIGGRGRASSARRRPDEACAEHRQDRGDHHRRRHCRHHCQGMRQRGRAEHAPMLVVHVRMPRAPAHPTTLCLRVRSRRSSTAGERSSRRRPTRRRRGARPDRTGPRRAGRTLRQGRARAGPGRRTGPRCDARPPPQRPRLHDVRTPGGDRAPARRLGRRHVGHRAGVRHDRESQGAVPGRDHDVPLGGVRRGLTQAVGRLRRQPRRRPRPSRLHRERDGGTGAVPRVRRPVRRRGRPRAGRAADAGATRGLLLRRPAADDAGRPVRRPARLRGRPGGGRGDDRDGRPDRDHLGGAGPRGAGEARACGVPTARADAAGRHRAGRARAA